MNQVLYVKDKHGECPNCHQIVEVVTPKGQGSIPQGDAKLRKITKGIKFEILNAYLQDPFREYTTRDIIHRINIKRHFNNKRKIERSNLTRPHSELVQSGAIIVTTKENYDFYYRIHVDKARFLLNRPEF